MSTSTSNTPPKDAIKPLPRRDTPQASQSSLSSAESSWGPSSIQSLDAEKDGQPEYIYTKLAVSAVQRPLSLLTKALEESRRAGTFESPASFEFEFVQKDVEENEPDKAHWFSLSEYGSSPPTRLLRHHGEKNSRHKKRKSSADTSRSVMIKCATCDYTFRVRRRTLLADMMEFFSMQTAIPIQEALFLWEGQELKEDDTPDGLGMGNQETIHISQRDKSQDQNTGT
jgi:Ubiquitin-2 like Rad60 SUMO-like